VPDRLAPLPFLAEAVREDLLDVRGALERQVVKRDQDRVRRHLEVRLDIVRPLLDRELVRRPGVLRRVRRGAPVGDQDLGGGIG
jgi:hypothetical protein